MQAHGADASLWKHEFLSVSRRWTGSADRRLELSFFSQTPGSDSYGTLWEDRRDKGGDISLGKAMSLEN